MLAKLLCWFFLFPFGLGLGLLLWRRRQNRLIVAKPTWEPSILWLTPTLKSLLGKCGDAEMLRNLENPERVLRCLERRAEERGGSIVIPALWQIATWRRQAELLFDGRLEELRAYHSEISDLPPQEPVQPTSEGIPEKVLIGSVICLALALIWFLAFWLSGSCNCKPEVVTQEAIDPNPPSKPITLSFSSDLFFKFNSDETPQVFRRRFQDKVRAALGQYATGAGFDVKLTKLTGFADPIGTDCSNKALAKRRASQALGLLSEMGIETQNAVAQSHYPNEKDKEIWGYCFNEYQSVAKNGLKPLLLRNAADATWCPDQTGDWYWRFDSNNLNVVKAQDGLISCLSALRRVEIQFEVKK